MGESRTFFGSRTFPTVSKEIPHNLGL